MSTIKESRLNRRVILFRLQCPSSTFKCPNCKMEYRLKQDSDYIDTLYILSVWDDVVVHNCCTICGNNGF